MVDICYNCNKAFNKERDKSALIRAVIAKFIEALKYKTSIPDVNFLYLGSMMLQVPKSPHFPPCFQDAKGELPPSSILEDVPRLEFCLAGPIQTGSTPYLECYLPDIVEFVADVHTLSKVGGGRSLWLPRSSPTCEDSPSASTRTPWGAASRRPSHSSSPSKSAI